MPPHRRRVGLRVSGARAFPPSLGVGQCGGRRSSTTRSRERRDRAAEPVDAEFIWRDLERRKPGANFPAASVSASPLPARWRAIPTFCCWMNRSRRSTGARAFTCMKRSLRFAQGLGDSDAARHPRRRRGVADSPTGCVCSIEGVVRFTAATGDVMAQPAARALLLGDESRSGKRRSLQTAV